MNSRSDAVIGGGEQGPKMTDGKSQASQEPDVVPNITITHAETKRVLAVVAHLNQIVRTAVVGDKVLRPTEMDHAELLLSAASLRALLFDDTPKPILLEFLDTHGLDIQIDAIETNLGLVLLSQLLPEPGHVSDVVGAALLGSNEGDRLPLDQETPMLFLFEDWAGLEQLQKRPDLWVPTKEQDATLNTWLTHASNVGPLQMLRLCRRRVSLKDWGGVRIGFLKDRRIDRRNLISYVANKLGGVHYDSKRKPKNLDDAEQFAVLASAYDWGDQSLMHAGLVAVALACIEIVTTPELMALRADFSRLYDKRQKLIAEKLGDALRARAKPAAS